MSRWAGLRKAVRARLPFSKAVNFLPIVRRELLVAAKSRRGFRLRMTVAVGATLLGGLTVLGWNFQGGGRAGGDGLFRFLSFLFFLVCCLSGVFLTADCLSREKREGTLGLLFLTDLRGVDIILGKLASTSLMTVLMVIGGFPVLAICVLLGGVTGAELFRTCLALLLTMLCSLSVGMFVSTFARESSQASGATLLLLLLLTIGIPALTSLAGWLSDKAPEGVFYFNFISPTFLIGSARAAPGIPDHFFAAVVATAATTVGLLGAASCFVRRTWQDRPRAQVASGAGRLAGGSRTAFRARRNPLLDQNPILWLTGAGVWQGRLLALALTLPPVVFWVTIPAWRPEMLEILPALNAYVLPYVLAVAVASTGAEFFVRLRQQGAFEFLLSTPLTDAELLRGQWLSLRRRFLLPAAVLLALIWIPGNSYRELPSVPDYPGTVYEELMSRLYLTAKSILLWLAAGWMGMHFGLKARRPQFAGLLAMLIGVGLPWMLWCLPEILVTGVLIHMGRETLRNRIRQHIIKRLEAGQPI